MPRRVLLLVALVVLCALALLFVVAPEARYSGADRGGATNGTDSRGAKSSRGLEGARGSLSPAEARRTVRSLLGGDDRDVPSFAAVSEMVRVLDDADLRGLVEDVGLGRADGMRGWLRAALFAEWGARDFPGAMTWLSENSERDSAHQQALYAVFRGSRPADPDEALNHLLAMIEKYKSAVGPFTKSWAEAAVGDVFADFARNDPKEAWQRLFPEMIGSPVMTTLNRLSIELAILPVVDSSSADWFALEGFFEGLPDLATVHEYADLFRVMWNTPEVAGALNRFRSGEHTHRLGGFGLDRIGPPPHEQAGRVIARAMANHDLEAGLEWMATSGPEAKREAGGRLQRMWSEWAQESPDQALHAMRSGKYEHWHSTIASALLRGDSRLGVPLAREFGDTNWFADALANSFPVAATMSGDELFPRPDRRPVLPDHEARYASFLEAMKASPLSGSDLATVRRSLDDAFRHTVDEARTAHEAAQAR